MSTQATDRAQILSEFEKTLGCRFQDKNLLNEALTHTSYVHEHPEEKATDYERLEFIGDAVLELAISHLLFNIRPDDGEGTLTRARADLVNKRRLAQIAEEIGVGNALRLGTGELKCRGTNKPSILASALEAVLGAMYLDQGWQPVFEVINRLVTPLVAAQPEDLREPRGILQEWVQAHSGEIPHYQFLTADGPAHDKVFRVQLIIGGEVLAVGEGKSKKDACRNAAALALKKIMPGRYNL